MPGSRWSREEIQIIRDCYVGEGALTCQRKMPERSLFAIRAQAIRVGLSTPKKAWSAEEEASMQEEYGTCPAASTQDRTKSAITQRARRLGLRGWSNEKAQDLSWTRDLAYFCGFVAADGGLSAPKGHGYVVRITLKFEDTYILQSFQTLYGGNIRARQAEGRKYSILEIYSKQMFKFLIEIGLTPNKTWTLRWARVPHEYLRDYVRGYFDGDGCIYWMRRTHPCWVMKFSCMSTPMLHELRRVLHTETGASDSAHIDSRIHSQALQYGKADTVKIGTWMYANNPSLFLQRKAQRFGAAFSDTAPDTAMMNIS